MGNNNTLNIIVVLDGIDKVVDDRLIKWGSNVSSDKKIDITPVDDGIYSIIYNESTFIKLHYQGVIKEIYKALCSDGDVLNICVNHLHDQHNYQENKEFVNKMLSLIEFCDEMAQLNYVNVELFDYEDNEIDNIITESDDNINDYDGIMGLLNGILPEEDDVDDYDDINSSDSIISMYDTSDDIVDINYNVSNIYNSSKNSINDFNEMGYIVAHSQKDIDNDARIIKRFLADFIPGNKKKHKKLRNEILKRWMNSIFLGDNTMKMAEKRIKHTQTLNNKGE